MSESKLPTCRSRRCKSKSDNESAKSNHIGAKQPEQEIQKAMQEKEVALQQLRRQVAELEYSGEDVPSDGEDQEEELRMRREFEAEEEILLLQLKREKNEYERQERRAEKSRKEIKEKERQMQRWLFKKDRNLHLAEHNKEEVVELIVFEEKKQTTLRSLVKRELDVPDLFIILREPRTCRSSGSKYVRLIFLCSLKNHIWSTLPPNNWINSPTKMGTKMIWYWIRVNDCPCHT